MDLEPRALDERIAAGATGCGRPAWSTRCAALVGRGLREGRTASRALGYQQVLRFLAGGAGPRSRPATRRSAATRRFVRRQRSWFRRDPRITLARRARRPTLVERTRLRVVADGSAMMARTCEFAKGHGTGNDFVILPDPDGRARPDARPGRGAVRPAARASARDGVLRVVRAAQHPEGRGSPTRPSGSWTTGTPTARSPRCAATGSGSSPATCSRPGWPPGRTGRCRSRPGPAWCARWSTATRSPSTWAGPGCTAPAPPPSAGSTLPGRRGRLWQPAPGLRAADEVELASLDLTRAPGVRPARSSRPGSTSSSSPPGRRGRRGPARADAGLRARLGRDPVLRLRRVRGGRGGAARRRPRRPAWSPWTCRAAG